MSTDSYNKPGAIFQHQVPEVGLYDSERMALSAFSSEMKVTSMCWYWFGSWGTGDWTQGLVHVA
jgi:hypothetical protein